MACRPASVGKRVPVPVKWAWVTTGGAMVVQASCCQVNQAALS